MERAAPSAEGAKASYPEPNPARMRETLEVLLDPADVVELRVLYPAGDGGKKPVVSRLYDQAHWANLVEDAERCNLAGAQCYVTLNPVQADWLRWDARRSAKDADITRRRWLLVDLDSARPAGTSATEAMVEAAHRLGVRICGAMQERGWPRPVVADSGNGIHLLWRIDLPNDDESRALVQSVLNGLSISFDTAAVTVDQTVHNASRITKLYGSVAGKGEHTAETPHRMSALFRIPEERVPVTIEQLQAVGALAPAKKAPAKKSALSAPGVVNSTDPIPQGADLGRLVDDLGSALEFLPADSYDNWFRIGLALKTLGAPGRELWMRWSATSTKHDDAEAGAKWDSFRPERTDYKVVFAAAQTVGWVNTGTATRLHAGASLSEIDTAGMIATSALRKAAGGAVGALAGTDGAEDAGPESEADGAATADDDRDADGLAGDATVFAPHLLNPPGMVGEIAKWMQDTAPKPQPVLAVAAALVLVGAALANKVRFGSSYTHLYLVNVANSGEGKDRPQKCISDALESAGASAAAKLPGSQIASGQALMTIGAREPTTVLIMDEFGDMLAKATAKTAAPFEREVTTFLKTQWSHAGSVMRGKEFADQKMRPRKDIQYPCISLLGSSTPARFYASITPDEIEDGLLNRMLIVRAANYDGVPIYRDPVPVPADVTGWLAAACSIKPGGLLAVDQPHQPRVVQCSPMAQKTLDEFSAEVEARRREMLAAPIRRQLAGWWVRASENARRIALILAVARHQDPQDLLLQAEDDAIHIDPTSAQWAVDYVRSIVLDMIEQSASRIGSSELERVVVAVEARLMKAGNLGLTRREAYRKCSAFGKIFDPVLATRVWESVHMRGAARCVYPASSGRGKAREVLVSRELKTAGEAV